MSGMVWSAFRPSDDPQKYSYNVPDNMYAVGALERLILLNEVTWRVRVKLSMHARLIESLR